MQVTSLAWVFYRQMSSNCSLSCYNAVKVLITKMINFILKGSVIRVKWNIQNCFLHEKTKASTIVLLVIVRVLVFKLGKNNLIRHNTSNPVFRDFFFLNDDNEN